MWRYRTKFILLLIPILILWVIVPIQAAPPGAITLLEGRTYDQAHDAGYIDWSGTVQYIHLTHRDGTSLPSSEGGASCNTNCTEWVTRLSNGSVASGSFDRDVSYFEVMVGFSPNASVGIATLRACSSVNTANLYLNSGLYPGFISMSIPVPAGCRSWSLMASGGYVDYRSVDVYYTGPAATANPTSSRTPTLTHTVTLTPTATFTPTPTPTFTFTPTATYTNTPSFTPTPLPPEIIGVVVCDLWGESGWCRGDQTLELSASDPQGFNVTITGDLNGISFSCGSSCSLSLPEGMGTAHYVVNSSSGRTADGVSTWLRDATPPEIIVGLPPVNGRNGWYVTEVEMTATATDSLSGLASLTGSLDDGWTWLPFPLHFTDGVRTFMVRAADAAGNETTVSNVIWVDTLPPTVQITSPSNGEVVQGAVQLSGTWEDETSGIDAGEVSRDGGETWQSMLMGADNTWSFLWESGEVPNGPYALQVRGLDRAGNVGDLITISPSVDNSGPSVSITERWWIWETGRLVVYPNHFSVVSVQVTIRDLQDRWPAVVMDLDPDKSSFPLLWDRRFADGALASSGEYAVLAVACDENSVCGQDRGRIVIPVMATSTATLTPSPTMTDIFTPSLMTTSTPGPPTEIPVWRTPLPDNIPEQVPESIPLWQIFGLLGLFTTMTSASLIDPRPAALGRLGEAIRLVVVQTKEDTFENKNKS